MKNVCIINFSGNVGKSTIAENIFFPRMPNTKLIQVETVNADAGTGANGEKLKSSNFDKVQEHIFLNENVLLDVGSSNAEIFIEELHRHTGAIDDIDVFLVPVKPSAKTQNDSILTIRALQNIGVDGKKIRVIFNEVPRGENPTNVFAALFGFNKRDGGFIVDETVFLEESEAFELLRKFKLNAQAVFDDERDFRTLIKIEKNDRERHKLMQLLILQRLIKGIKPQFDALFEFAMSN